MKSDASTVAGNGAGSTAEIEPPVLVVGYGNALRGDDGVGCHLAEEIAGWNRPGLRVLVVPQLYPELASEIASARQVIFLDAREAHGKSSVEAHRLRGREESLPLGHALSPEGVVGLAEDLYESRLDGWVVTVPAFEFGWRESLSPRTVAFLPAARQTVLRILEPG